MRDANIVAEIGHTRQVPTSTWRPRLNATQVAAYERALPRGFKLSDEEIEELGIYAATGDASTLSDELRDILTTVCKTARVGLSESQAKRIWPRKLASHILTR